MTEKTFRRTGAVALIVLFAAGALPRAWNLFHYPVDMSFDAKGHWEYIAMLMNEWRIPDPGEGWSTAHPPFFYVAAAAIGRLIGTMDKEVVSRAVIAICNVLGLASIAAIAFYVRDRTRDAGRASWIAAALLLFLPVHVYTSAMLGEEMLVTALIAFAMIGLAREVGRPASERSDIARPSLLGALAGLALLTKLSAALPIAAGAAVLAAEGRRRGWNRALTSAAAFAGAATLTGGWFYVQSLASYGEAYPYALPVHSLMFDMPPGSRTLADYLYIPFATFRAVQASDASLLHSVWGGLWTSTWFDSHRHFVPLSPTPGLELAARIMLVLGLVPAAAFAIGLARGARRAIVDGSGPDRLFVGMTILTLAGFVAFTWKNPWFVCVKGSYLLVLSAPYAIYASETLEEWMRARRGLSLLLATMLVVFAVVSNITFSYNAVFVKQEFPGTEWKRVAPSSANETAP